MPLVYVFAASKMEAQPVLVLAARDGASSKGSGALIIEHGGDGVPARTNDTPIRVARRARMSEGGKMSDWQPAPYRL
jgi:hypothetical protein